jgi:hypothetical protein
MGPFRLLRVACATTTPVAQRLLFHRSVEPEQGASVNN